MLLQTLTILHILTTILAQTNGPYADLFTYDEYVTIQNKRIRREIRDLSDDEWDAIANAMNIMKNTTTVKGRILYGDTYYSYDDLVCQHARGAMHTGGDLSHSGPQFNIWHRAFVLSFENILISIDPSIQGVPYWDFRIDINEQGSDYNMTNSIIFSDKYFGEYSTVNDENKDYAVKGGKFGYWPVNDDPDILEFRCGGRFRNAFGLLRKKTNPEDTPYFTRFGGYMCGSPEAIGVLSTYDRCLNDETDYTNFWACYDGGVHGSAHHGVGGSRLSFEGQTQSDSCRSFGGSGVFVQNVRLLSINYGCYDCPTPGSCVSGVDDPYECGMCSYSNLVDHHPDGRSACPVSRELVFPMVGEADEQQIIGDFVDQVTSPNDPIFMFHHANIDRYLMEWQIRNYEQAPYYNYPTSGYATGANLNDVITPEAPFTNLFNDPEGGPYTFKDIWDETEILESAYTYDTILEMIEQSGTSMPSLSPSPDPTPPPTDICDCYTLTLLNEQIRGGDNRCYRYEVNFCDDEVNSVVLGTSASRRECGIDSYQSVVVSIQAPNYVTTDTNHIGNPRVTGLRLDGLQNGDRFGVCFDMDTVEGTTTNGNTEYITDSMEYVCAPSDTLPNLCGGIGSAQIVSHHEQSGYRISEHPLLVYIWSSLCAAVVTIFTLSIFYICCIKQKGIKVDDKLIEKDEEI